MSRELKVKFPQHVVSKLYLFDLSQLGCIISLWLLDVSPLLIYKAYNFLVLDNIAGASDYSERRRNSFQTTETFVSQILTYYPQKQDLANCSTLQSIPVIELNEYIDKNRQELVQRIIKAGQEFGFFQLTEHGISEELMRDVLKVAEEFFQLPTDDKASLYSEDARKDCRLYTSINYDLENVHFWRDNLRHSCHPLQDHVKEWPTNPRRYRDVIGKYSVRVRELSLLILDLIGEGLGLESGYFEGGLSQVQLMNLNCYPSCPDPSLTLGLPKHSDPNLITLLNQGLVPGLQVLQDGEWSTVEPIPNAFVVNIGYTLQAISNGKLRSADHRVVTNTNVGRTTVASFINPSGDAQVAPAAGSINRSSPPMYRPFTFNEFMRNYMKDAPEGRPGHL